MRKLNELNVLVAGGTGNVGGFIVSGLLERGATVAVPSRSEPKLEDLRSFLTRRGNERDLDRLITHVGDLTDPDGAAEILPAIEARTGQLNAALASLGHFRPAKSLLSVPSDDLDAVLEGYVGAHMKVASTILSYLKEREATYVFVNGPLAFDVWPGSAAGLVSIATAAQHMLFRVLAQEMTDSPVQVIELVTHAFIRNRTTQPPSPLGGEDVGAFAAHLLTGAGNHHGESIQLRTQDQLKAMGNGTSTTA